MFRKGCKADSNALLHVRVVEAKNLVPMDAGNKSDPYVTMKVGKNGRQKHTTKIVYKSLNPVWNEEFTFGVNEKDLKEPLVIKIYDHDTFSDEFMGRALIDLSSLVMQAKEQLTSEIQGWYTLLDLEGINPVPGAIYIKCVWERPFVSDHELPSFLQRRLSLLALSQNDADESSDDEDEKKGDAAVNAAAAAAKAPRAKKPLDTIKVAACSWNVGNAPPPDDLSPWIPKEGYRIIAIGGQECNYKARSGYQTCDADWQGTVSKYLGDTYTLVEAHNLWEMRLLIYVETAFAHLVSNVCTSSEATGIGHVLGNKGGVIVSLSYRDTSLCFVNSHLAAHQGKTKARNDNFREIVEGAGVGFAPMDILNQFQHVIWMGDLNYRLDFGDQGDKETPSKETFEALCAEIEAGKFEELYQNCDQLRREIAEKRGFPGFVDLQPRFKPTFKVERNKYLEYKSQRSPAWCDRVLYASLPKFGMKPVDFNMYPEIMTSDHKPVRASFEVEVFDLPPGFDDSVGECTLEFRSMEGVNLNAADVNGLSDPYVKFLGPFLSKSDKTAVINNTLNPKWQDDQLPKLNLAVTSASRLKMQYLMFAVMDHDVGSENDYIGGAALMMSDVIRGKDKSNGKWQQFCMDLTCGGHPAGQLKFEVKITWAAPAVQRVVSNA